ncbi:hypothetical protein [Brevibacterium otitidis]|uniref:Cell division protein FtsL n=1 Tax=Brevibacterium otitidis TaxID=53364 RepID=A0ABV5X6E5_9MICO|nr:hypothetical protein GCM10023233_09620 [Brevibacterium otitidis]
MSSAARAVTSSAASRASRSLSAPLTRGEAARLKLIVPGLAARRTPLSLAFLGVLLLGVVAVLLLNIFISHSSFQVEKLTAEQRQLHSERDRLTEDISYRGSPQAITSAAEEMGMKQPAQVKYLRLSDGSIIESGEVPALREGSAEKVPGPRADTRDAVRPNLRSEEKLPAVGDSGSEELSPPQLTVPR